ncbi:MAG: hypothetical protein AAFV49_13355 [Pseudomonadota bacterium]
MTDDPSPKGTRRGRRLRLIGLVLLPIAALSIGLAMGACSGGGDRPSGSQGLTGAFSLSALGADLACVRSFMR